MSHTTSATTLRKIKVKWYGRAIAKPFPYLRNKAKAEARPAVAVMTAGMRVRTETNIDILRARRVRPVVGKDRAYKGTRYYFFTTLPTRPAFDGLEGRLV